MVNSGKQFTWKNRKGGEKTFGRERKVGERCDRKRKEGEDEDVDLSCRQDCKNISDEARQMIHDSFWNLGSVMLQRNFIADHVKVLPKKRERKRKDENNTNPKPRRNRQGTRQYQLTTNHQRIVVCQKFFLSTLCIDEKRVRHVLSSISTTGTVAQDQRGCHDNHFNVALDEQAVVEHISKFKTVDSHYVRLTAKAQYLPEELTVKAMHNMYVEDHDGKGKVKDYKFYHRIFTERFNLKFQKNKKDQCDKCEVFKNMPDEKKTPEIIEEHDMHIDEKDLARDGKSQMKTMGEEEDVVSAAFDLEKVLLVPHGQTSSFYYSKRLKIHNFTVTDIARMHTFCYVWHEGEAKKGSCEVGTCLQQFIREVHASKVNLFADQCGGQTKL